MVTQEERLSPEERQKRFQEDHYAKQVAVRDAQLYNLRQQAEQATQCSYGIPSTIGLLAYPPLRSQVNPQLPGEMSPEEQQKRRQLVHAIRPELMSPEQQQQAKMRQLVVQRGRQIAGMGYQQMGDGIPNKCPSDVELRVGLEADVPDFVNFRSACREGDLSTVKSIVSSQSRSPLYLHEGLDDALKNGKVGVSRFLLQSRAPIKRATPAAVLRAPADKQVALFQVLIEHGWTVNTPESLLPEIFRSNNEPLFDWFLEQDANPNVAGPQNDLGQTLRLAASQGTVQVVQKLLNAGANMASSGLYWAAGAYPEDSVPNIRRVEPSADFDKSRIPVMELLLENGGDVNHRLETRHMEELYPIVNAVKAGAVERVKWLLSKGADPDLKGSWGSARDYAKLNSSDEMKQVLGVEQ
ncbi:Ankyrin repeat domain-containing protein 17 [Fusarium oxysporum f. sp. cubense]|uniref:Ankyrin repeat domain-containing protein 17 n=1 Tax=Fusarium oxysporum f. sp. cubense TaxID=61366 RepID=A0A559LKW2_FUSOC|nr:Ankyrin repeat domain-containing protein 17 [Fusarium oxysporum f. sp. cubense]